MTEQLARFQRTTRHIDNEPCLNCDTHYIGNFCPRCGQESYTGAPTTWGFIYEFLTRYVFEGGKLPRTLWHLIRYPGSLTVDFLEGRRERYVRPVRLFFGVTAVYFLCLIFVGERIVDQSVEQFKTQFAAQEHHRTAASLPGTAKIDQSKPGAKPKEKKLALGATVSAIANRLPEGAAKQRGLHIAELPESELVRLVMKGEFASMQKATFFLLPVFALLLKLLFVRRKINFGVHLLFSFHYHCASFLVYLFFLPLPVLFAGVTVPLFWAYLFIAIRQVYVCSRWAAFFYSSAVLLAQLVLTGLVVFGMSLFALFWPG